MTDYTSWHVGMKVVCVDDNFANLDAREKTPEAGRVYTIRTISRSLRDGGIGIRLAEIINPPNSGRDCDNFGSAEFGFRIERFKPAHERKTDISIFTAMLHDKKERAPT